jgi:hypothetical protein
VVKGPETLLGMAAQARALPVNQSSKRMADRIGSLAGAGRSLLLSPTSDVMVRFFASSSGSWVAGAGRVYFCSLSFFSVFAR